MSRGDGDSWLDPVIMPRTMALIMESCRMPLSYKAYMRHAWGFWTLHEARGSSFKASDVFGL